MRTIAVLFITALLLPIQSFADMDLAAYDLNQKQVELIRKLEAKGTDPTVLKGFAEALQRDNQKKQMYIPPYTQEDLYGVTDWAVGAVFRIHAENAGYVFDYQAYMADCPNIAIFNFGRATGMTVLNHDVLAKFINVLYAMDLAHARDPENFVAYYKNALENSEFKKYLTPKVVLD